MPVTYRAASASLATGTTSVTPALPAGVAAGDLLLAFIVDHATSGNSSAPSGWTRQGGAAGSAGRFQVFSIIYSSGGPWAFSGLTSRSGGRILAFYGENQTTPLDVAVSARINASGTTGTTSITPVTGASMIVGAFASLANGATWTAEAVATNPGALTEQVDSAYSTYLSLAVAIAPQKAAAATGASSATMSTNAANAGILLAIRDAFPTLAAGLAGFTEDAKAIGLKADRKVASQLAVFSETALAAGLHKGYPMSAALANFALSGKDLGLKAARKIGADLASFSVGGQSIALKFERKIAGGSADFSLNILDVGLKSARALPAAATPFSLSATAAGLKAARILPCAMAPLQLSALSAGLKFERKLSSDMASFSFIGFSAGLSGSRKIGIQPATFALDALGLGLRVDRLLPPPLSIFSLMVHDADLSKGISGYSLQAGAGSFFLSAIDASLKATHRLPAAIASYSLAVVDGDLNLDRRLSADQAGFVLTALDADLLQDPIGYSLSAGTAVLSLIMLDADLRAARLISTGQASHVLVGREAELSIARFLLAPSALYSLLTMDVLRASDKRLSVSTADFLLRILGAILLHTIPVLPGSEYRTVSPAKAEATQRRQISGTASMKSSEKTITGEPGATASPRRS